MLKWTRKKSHAWINDMFNHAWQHGMVQDRRIVWTEYLHKRGGIYNYRRIMVGSLIA